MPQLNGFTAVTQWFDRDMSKKYTNILIKKKTLKLRPTEYTQEGSLLKYMEIHMYIATQLSALVRH